MPEGARPERRSDALKTTAPVRPHVGATTDLVGEAADIVLCDQGTSPVLCDAYLYEPDGGERVLGSLALVAETINLPGAAEGAPTARELLDTLATTVRKEYYSAPSREILASFEAALASANTALARVAERGGADGLMNLQVAVVAYAGGAVHVSRVGSPSILLVRNGHVTDIGEDLSDPRVRNPRAVFTNVASGTVNEQDMILLAGQNVFRIIPKDRLATLVAGKSPRDAVVYTRELLLEASDAVPVAAVFLQFLRAPLALPAPSLPPEERSRAFALPAAATLRSTAYPPLPGRGAGGRRGFGRRDGLGTFRFPVGRWRRTLASAQSVGRLARHIVTTYVGPGLTRAVQRGSRAARAAAQRAGDSTTRLPRPEPPANREAMERGDLEATRPPLGPAGDTLSSTRGPLARIKPASVLRTVVRAPRQIRSLFAGWPRSTKVFFVSTGIFAILFAGSLRLLRHKSVEDAKIRAASEQLQAARVQSATAEAALIYENTDEARRLLREARAHMERVRQTPYYAAEASALFATLEATEDKANRVVRIPSPAPVGDFRSVAPDGRVAGLAAVGAQLFSFQPDTNAIFRLASDTGEISTVSQTSQGIGSFHRALSLPGEQALLFSTNAPGLAYFDTTRGELLKQEVNPLPDGTKTIRDLATFGSRLYLLVPEHRQVLGYSKTLAGYQDGAPWVKDERVPVDRAIALGVDGYLYLLLQDGKIVKLLKGAPVEFAQSELSTPLRNPTRLLINETLKHLYVLDPPEKRVVVYDTTGTLTRQYVFPQAHDLRDLAIGGKEETLFLLDETTVVQVPLDLPRAP